MNDVLSTGFETSPKGFSFRHRLPWADIAKGIAILLVVYGHTCGDYFTKFLYFFHMPLFMMVSGYFLSNKGGYRDFCKRKAASLLSPYITYFIIGFMLNWLYELCFYANHPPIPSFIGKISELVLPFYGTGATAGLWFLIALMILSVFLGGLIRMTTPVVVGGAVLGLNLGAYFTRESIRLPFFLSPALMLSIYFIGGYFLKRGGVFSGAVVEKME